MPFFHPGLIIRKQIFEDIGYFDKNFKIAMDFALVMKLIKFKYNGQYLATAPAVEMDGKGASSTQAILAVNERIRILKDLGLYSFSARKFLCVLRLKLYLRSFICALGLEDFYDHLKGRI